MSSAMDARGSAKKSRGESNNGSRTPLLGVEHKGKWALWELSLVLAEIASQDRLNQSAESQNDDQPTKNLPRE